jgi:hypothetical protein
LLIGWGTAIAALPLTLFNPIGSTCWIGPRPLNCETMGDCVRGDNASMYRWAFFYHAYLFPSFGFVSAAMLWMHWNIRKTERNSERYRLVPKNAVLGTSSLNTNAAVPQRRRAEQERNEQRKRRMSRRFVEQAWYFVFAFLITWVFPLTSYLTLIQEDGALSFEMLCLNVFFSPLQGFWNACIYIRPRYIQQLKRQQKESKPNGQRKSHYEALVSAIVADDGHDEEEYDADGHFEEDDDEIASVVYSA